MKEQAWELIPRFARCANYPKDDAALEALVDGLVAAAHKTGVAMAAIVDRCVSESLWCPADFDLLTVAREIRGPMATRPANVKCPEEICDGSGWRIVYYLWTIHSGDEGHNYTEKQPITQQQHDDLGRKPLDWNKQQIYGGAFRCKCHPAREVQHEPKKKRGA